MAKKQIAKIIIEGVIEKKNSTYSQKWVLDQISGLKKNRNNAGILLYIDSPGGGVYQSDEVYEAVSMATLAKISTFLNCGIDDIVKIKPTTEVNNEQ